MPRVVLVSTIAACALAFASPAQAGILSTVSGTDGDGAVSASATFDISAGHITVTLSNTLDPSVYHSIGQSVSDVQFTLSNGPGTYNSATATAFGQQANIDKKGNVSYIAGSTVPGRFLGIGGGDFSIIGNTILLEAIGGGQPDQLIAPYIADGGKYLSGDGMPPHNPSTIGPAVFNLDLSGVTANTTITAVEFSFGTGPDTIMGGQLTPTPTPTPTVPVPPTLTMGMIGAGNLALFGWLRRRKN